MTTAASGAVGAWARVQRFGIFLSGMIIGSIIAFALMGAKGHLITIYIVILAVLAVVFVISWLALRSHKSEEIDVHHGGATPGIEEAKGRPSPAGQHLVGVGVPSSEIRRIAIACDAGMGPSAMGASMLRSKIKEAGFADVTVVSQAIANLKDDYQVVVTHKDLATRAAPKVPSATLLTVDNFMGSPRYDEVVEMIRAQRSVPRSAAVDAPGSSTGVAAQSDEEAEGDVGVLNIRSITLHGSARSKDDAIREAGQMLVEGGAVDNGYVSAMYDREKSVSTFMGNGLAIPHGTNEAKQFVNRSAMSFVHYDQPIDWNGNPVRFVIGIAGKNKEHLTILGKIARIFSDMESVQALEEARTEQEVLDILKKVNS